MKFWQVTSRKHWSFFSLPPLWHIILMSKLHQAIYFAMLSSFVEVFEHGHAPDQMMNLLSTYTKRLISIKFTTIKKERTGIISRGVGCLLFSSIVGVLISNKFQSGNIHWNITSLYSGNASPAKNLISFCPLCCSA